VLFAASSYWIKTNWHHKHAALISSAFREQGTPLSKGRILLIFSENIIFASDKEKNYCRRLMAAIVAVGFWPAFKWRGEALLGHK